MTTAIWPAAHRPEPLTLRAAIVAACALLSIGAAVIHFAVLGEHWREWWGYGLFFGVSAWLQLAWAALVVPRPSRTVLVIGAVANLAIAALWLLTRTGGIPLGPAAGETESATFSDILAAAFEVALGLSALAVAAAHAEQPTIRRWLGVAVMLAIAAAVVILTTVGLVDASAADGSHNGDSNGAIHDHAAAQH